MGFNPVILVLDACLLWTEGFSDLAGSQSGEETAIDLVAKQQRLKAVQNIAGAPASRHCDVCVTKPFRTNPSVPRKFTGEALHGRAFTLPVTHTRSFYPSDTATLTDAYFHALRFRSLSATESPIT